MFVSEIDFFKSYVEREVKLLPQQERKPREGKSPGGVIHHIHLAGIEARFELGQRHIQLENGCASISRVQLIHFLQRTLIRLHLPLKKGDVSQKPDPRIVTSL